MNPKFEQIQIHYELAMSIGTSLNLKEMLRKSLTTFLRKLNCPAGGVHFYTRGNDDIYQREHILTIPQDISYIKDYQRALSLIPAELSSESSLAAFNNSLPFSSKADEGTFTIAEVPGLGVMVLLKSDALDSQFIKSLEPIFKKLAIACNACLQNEEIVGHQNNLQQLVAEKTSELVSKNQQLIESEGRYRALFTNEIDAISIFEIETLKIVDVNDAWLKLYGYKRDDLGSLTIKDVTAEETSTQKAVNHSVRTGSVFIPERHHLKKDGTPFIVELSAGPFTWKGQQLMYALVRDITERKKADDKLKESEKLLAETQKIAQLGSWEFDVGTEEIIWSRETFRIAGRQPKEKLTLKEYLSTIHQDDLPLFQQVLEKSTVEKKPYELELRHQRPDGSYNYTVTRGKPIVKDEQIVKFIGSVLDITERKQAEQELQQAKDYLENVLQNSPDGIGIVDKNGMFFKWNNAAAQLYGFSYEELAGKSFTEFYPDEKKLNKMLRQLRQSGYLRRYEIEMLRKDGEILPFELSISVLKDENEKTIGSVCLARNLSDTKKHLAELTTAYDELQRTKKAAEAANKAKSAFLANMSHELRTPLNAIIGFSELMTRDISLSKGQLKDLGIIVSSGEHLLTLINDVLEVSKIEADQILLHNEYFDLHQFLSGLEEMFRLRVEQKGLSLDFEQSEKVPRVILGDQSKLRQILINLLGNAVKFTHKGGVSLRVTCSQQQELSKKDICGLLFQVSDTGIGITHADQGKVFEAFFQSGERSSVYQGTGLGLPISKKFVSMMGGNLELDSDIGRGTTFSFEIFVEHGGDIGVEVSQIARRVIGLEAGQPPFRLLVVEDNVNSRNLLVELLRIVGFDVQEAINGQDALEKWRRWQPHLIWMDMRMPVIDGYQATKLIKAEMQASQPGINTKIIALTASAFEEDRQKVIHHGCDDFVRKPFRESEIFGMMKKHLGVKFVYAGHPGSTTDGVRQTSIDDLIPHIEALPLDILQRLAESTELSDAVMIDQVISEIRSVNNTLADSLAGMAEIFAYDDILEIIERAK